MARDDRKKPFKPFRRDRPKDRSTSRGFSRARGKPDALPDGVTVLYGWHTVQAALDNPQRRIRKLYATENATKRLAEEGVRLTVEPQLVRPDEIARRLSADAVHNGLLAEAEPLEPPDLSELPAEGIVLVLDQITDPHNVGAILRSAAAFGVKALVTTARHSPEATGALAKSASGALEYVPMVLVQNLARGLHALKDCGFLVVGLDSEGDTDLSAAPLSSPLALVLGAEGKGLRQLTRETCDRLARIDLPGEIKSLNVSNAAALALYVATTRLKA
ncbi:MAG: 23S rRNA (guanosine(2251)-2'-O)-methyltransferase RlmB [Pseudorhodoplanes sp.]